MTIDEFLEKLKETPREWCITGTGTIRSHRGLGDWTCPVCKVAGVSGQMAWMHIKSLGLSQCDADSIVAAADLRPEYSETLRARMLYACGLSPSGARTT